jgi:hypothetical protein
MCAVMQKRSVDNQTLYQVKLVFPRGDATSLLFAFDAEGKITGVSARPASCEPGHLDLLIQYSTIK